MSCTVLNSILSRAGRSLLGLLAMLWVAAPVTGETPEKASARTPIEFNRDIRPILAEHCLACHGPDKAKRKAGLRLDDPQSATALLESGQRAIVPGQASTSRLLQVVETADDDDRMPPKKTGKRLSSEQIRLLKEWIDSGAVFQTHWAYLPPQRPPLPPVKNTAWPRDDMDRFILARLEQEGLQPSPETGKETWIRRATLDLTGLPPTVAEIDAFLADDSPKNYEAVADRLLASPAFGEKMAIHWLDLARYADSDGYHADTARSMWQYRDYVVRSFNANKPFDQFTVEQLAGDLLPNPTLDQRIATAFNRNGMSSTEGGADPDEYLNKYVTDRVNTFGTVFLGSSTACTECHDHKYDPFTQKEYYQLYDFFNRIPERGLDSDPAPPFIKVPVTEQAEKLAGLNREIAELETRRKEWLVATNTAADREQDAWEDSRQRPIHSGWSVLNPESVSTTSGASLRMLGDLSVLASGTNASREIYEVHSTTAWTQLTAFRIEALLHEGLRLNGPGRSTNGGFSLTGFEVDAASAHPAMEPGVEDLVWGHWHSVGPFRAASPKEIFEKSFLSEGKVDLSAPQGETGLRWVEAKGITDGQPYPMSGENEATYLYRTITAKRAQYVQVAIGSDGGAQLWLNGVRVQEGAVFRRAAPAPDPVLLLLQPGENQLLIKVHRGSGIYGFLFGRPTEPVTRYRVEWATALADAASKSKAETGLLDDKPETGWGIDGADTAQHGDRQVVLLPKRPVVFAGGVRLILRLRFEGPAPQEAIGRFRLAVSSSSGFAEFAALPDTVRSALFVPPGRLTEARRAELRDYFRDHFLPELRELHGKLAVSRKALADLDRSIPTLRVMEDSGERRVTQIRIRGDYRAKGDVVGAGVPAVLPPLPADGTTNRWTLARWLVDPQHPLLARVTVNRYWALYFGTGLVKTGNEFGTQGELPSHPELLDWLAREFIEGGWNVKQFQKRIVLSATYRQSSRVTSEALERDPSNRLLARGPRIRLPAEVIRDCALDYAGLLDRSRTPGGPSVKPYQPPGLWEEKMFGGNRYEESKGADLYRRSLYTLWKRTVLNPTLMTFDAPDRAICTEQRSQTCTPLQAFVTLNEKGFVESARLLAERILKEGGAELEPRIRHAFRLVLGRFPTSSESAILRKVHADLFQAYQDDLQAALDLLSTGNAPKADKVNQLDLAAWTGVANVLLNLDETITKE